MLEYLLSKQSDQAQVGFHSRDIQTQYVKNLLCFAQLQALQ